MRNAANAILFLLLAAVAARSQSTSQFTVYTDVAGATFRVDGQPYTSQTVFLWPAGSKHTLVLDAISYDNDRGRQYSCTSWSDSSGLLMSGGGLTQVVTADPNITSFKGTCTVSGFRVDLFFNGDAVSPSAASTACGGAASTDPVLPGPGIVQVSSPGMSGCFGQSTSFYTSGRMTLNATPYSGWVFTGWSPSGASATAYMTTFNVTGPFQLSARFEMARRARFRTNPPGLEVAIDHNIVTTAAETICADSDRLPQGPIPGVNIPGSYGPLCKGDFDFALGSSHTLGAPSPQTVAGASWIFDSWQDGSGQNAVYTVPLGLGVDSFTARFVPGVRVVMTTKPFGLKIGVDGRTSWPNYSFVWAEGSKHTLAAPAEQADSNGRRYAFTGWSMGGEATQEYTVPAEQIGILVANYELLGRVKIASSPSGINVQVDDETCTTPCTLDRAVGTTVKVTAPSSVMLAEGTRADFSGWNDAGTQTRTYTFTTGSDYIGAIYQTYYQLSLSSDPGQAAIFQCSPESPDNFYPSNSQVALSVKANPGFKFLRWTGDIMNSLGGATLVAMSGPRSARALFEKVPYIAPNGVVNAAGVTPDEVVAPGSLIAITGASLVDQPVVGPPNPLAQTLAGIYVMMEDRILPLVSIEPDKITALLPSDVKPGDHTLKVIMPVQPTAATDFTVAANAPGLFESHDEDGNTFAAAIHEDGTPITPASPAKRDELITLFGTGFGPYERRLVDGFAVPKTAHISLTDNVTLWLGEGSTAPVWTGAAPGMVGITETQFRLTSDLPPATAVKIKATVNERDSNTVELPVE
ncbi:MAG: hypothetical protein IT160_18495 [Bryobacterales bacterium]|nr:hypothetical protein [Bryobacterales bacterium]